MEICSLPIIAGLPEIEHGITVDYRLTQGHSAETSGGLLVVLPSEKLDLFMASVECWIVGRVVEGNRCARLVENPLIVHI